LRKVILNIGLLLVVIGAFVLSQGPQFLVPISESVGLATNVQTVETVISPTLITVAPSNYTFVDADLKAGTQVNGFVTVGDDKEIAVYVMDEGNFSEWQKGHPSTIALAKPYVVSSNFTLTPTTAGTYFFVFDNQDTTRRAVIFSLSAVQSHSVLDPVAEYAGYESIVIGVLFTTLGLKTGKKKRRSIESEKPRTTNGWSCKYCAAENTSGAVFCSGCSRSRE